MAKPGFWISQTHLASCFPLSHLHVHTWHRHSVVQTKCPSRPSLPSFLTFHIQFDNSADMSPDQSLSPLPPSQIEPPSSLVCECNGTSLPPGVTLDPTTISPWSQSVPSRWPQVVPFLPRTPCPRLPVVLAIAPQGVVFQICVLGGKDTPGKGQINSLDFVGHVGVCHLIIIFSAFIFVSMSVSIPVFISF